MLDERNKARETAAAAAAAATAAAEAAAVSAQSEISLKGAQSPPASPNKAKEVTSDANTAVVTITST